MLHFLSLTARYAETRHAFSTLRLKVAYSMQTHLSRCVCCGAMVQCRLTTYSGTLTDYELVTLSLFDNYV